MFFVSNYVKRIIGLTVSLAMVGSVAGCGASATQLHSDKQPSVAVLKSGTKYEVPVQLPNILADQIGYDVQSEKALVFRGAGIPISFYIYDKESGEMVFTAETFNPVYNAELDEYDCVGYFNELKRSGTYYAYSDVLGESYTFEIKDNIFSDVFELACRKYRDSLNSKGHSETDTARRCRVAENLLIANELNGSAFTDNTKVPESGNQIPDILDEVRLEAESLLEMQDQKTGGIYGSSSSGISMEATISFAGMMSAFSLQYRKFDEAFATRALQAADIAWECFLKNEDPKDNTMAFFAAATLYRATGADEYRQVLENCFLRSDFEELFNSDEAVFLGAVTYLSINQDVDIEICKKLMKYLMERAETIAERSSQSAYLVTDIPRDGNFEKMLNDMRCLTITDHVIYNHEYTTIIENHMHFLCGMNPEAVNYVTDNTAGSYKDSGLDSILDDPEQNSLLIFMLSVLENK